MSCSHVLFVDKFNNELFLFKVDYINSVYSYEKFISDEFEILDKFFFKENKNLYLVKDEVTIDQNLFIPQGYKVIVKPNQKILLTNSAFIISKSPWIIGGKNGDVVISGTKKSLGGGILITDSKEFSKNSKYKNFILNWTKKKFRLPIFNFRFN